MVAQEIQAQPGSSSDAVLESIKLAFETVKHLTSLNAGSILLIATFLRDIFPRGPDERLAVGQAIKFLIGGSLVAFGISLVISAIAMWGLSRMVRTERLPRLNFRLRLYMGLPSLFFVFGLGLFGGSVLAELF
jgi:hypothetical protein